MQHIVDGVHAGNIYVNRNQIGAVVGSQPFGGEGLSGTGPKAGGPHYLRRFRKSASAGAEQPEATASQPARRSPSICPTRRWAAGRRAPDRIAILRKHLRGKGAEPIAAAAAHRFRSGRPARADRRGEHADAASARPRALPRAGCRYAACPGDPGAGGRQCRAGRGGGGAAALQPLTGKGLPIAALDGGIEPENLKALAIDVVASSADEKTLRAMRQALADRKGPIVPLVTEIINPAAYAHERAVCVDTTAAGGNASLLAAA